MFYCREIHQHSHFTSVTDGPNGCGHLSQDTSRVSGNRIRRAKQGTERKLRHNRIMRTCWKDPNLIDSYWNQKKVAFYRV